MNFLKRLFREWFPKEEPPPVPRWPLDDDVIVIYLSKMNPNLYDHGVKIVVEFFNSPSSQHFVGVLGHLRNIDLNNLDDRRRVISTAKRWISRLPDQYCSDRCLVSVRAETEHDEAIVVSDGFIREMKHQHMEWAKTSQHPVAVWLRNR